MTRRLIRARDVAGFRRAVVRLCGEGTLGDIRRRVVVLPSRASVELLRQTLERHADDGTATVLPDLLTRDEWLARWIEALPGQPRLLSRVEREVMLAAAAEATAARPRMGHAPFRVRPGLIAAMLDFYDELLRRQRTVGRLRREVIAQLKSVSGFDRGSDNLIHQTAFLTLAYLKYERAVLASGAIDEHMGRAQLATVPDPPHTHVVVAVADHPSDPRGLWPADFDLIGRCAGLRIDVVMTDELHDAGFRQRLERELPGIEETREPGAPWTPVVSKPESQWHWLARDREEEVREVARRIRARAIATGTLAPTALVVQRPLPYLYLLRQLFDDARLPWQALEALPLAGEPWAALLDLTLAVARTGGTRESMPALLRSPWLSVAVDDTTIDARDVSALEAVLVARRVEGAADTYPQQVEAFAAGADRRDGVDVSRARRAAAAAVVYAEALEGFRGVASASGQVRTIAAFLRRFERPLGAAAPWHDGARRARAAILGALDGLAEALARHDDTARPPEDLVAWMRHRLEGQTFSVARAHAGVHLVDAVAARFGEFDHVHVLGLVDTDWPERQRRNIFYTSGLLKDLGWPQDADHSAAQIAAFRDLTGLPSETISFHAFELDADAVVGPSPMLDLVRGLPSREDAPPPRLAVFSDEVLALPTPSADHLDQAQHQWAVARAARPDTTGPAYRGQVAPQLPQPYRVSRVDRYVTCPFKYFAESVLRLPEEREETAGLSPLERGNLLHDLLERFYRDWQAAGHGAITPALLPEAVSQFAELARATLDRLPDADRALEHTRLLGSLVARGVAERVFELEAEADERVDYRLLEEPLKGTFVFPKHSGLAQTEIAINGKADRIDVLTDGRIRVIDYKLGRMPDLESSIQIAVYAHAARQQLEAADEQTHPVAAASYLAFGDEYKLEGPIGRSQDADVAVQARAAVFADTIERIERGQFPPRPRDTSECEWCRYSGVCRKEYALEEDAADAV
jgi:RecB family exonuclease